MKRIIGLAVMGLFLFAACQSDGGDASTEAPSSDTAQTAQNAEAESVKHSNPSVKGVFFYMDDVEAAAGETVCLDVKVKNFKEIESNQYSVNWDPRALEFVAIKNIQLKDMTQTNFGLTRTAEGNFGVSWFDPSLKSVTLPDGATLYQICFLVKAPSGTETSVKFSGTPIAIEFSNVHEDLVGFSARRTHVKVK